MVTINILSVILCYGFPRRHHWGKLDKGYTGSLCIFPSDYSTTLSAEQKGTHRCQRWAHWRPPQHHPVLPVVLRKWCCLPGYCQPWGRRTVAVARILRVLGMNSHASHILVWSGMSAHLRMMSPSSTIIYIQISEPSHRFPVTALLLEAWRSGPQGAPRSHRASLLTLWPF